MSSIFLRHLDEISYMAYGLNYLAGADDGDLYIEVKNLPVVFDTEIIGYINLGDEPNDNEWVFSLEKKEDA